MKAPELFKQLLKGKTLILDTETTGLDADSEIVEITVIDTNGKVLLDTLVRPVNRIPRSATAIHGITNEMVADAPSWLEVVSQLWSIIVNEQGVHDKIAIYNADYDVKLIKQSSRIALAAARKTGEGTPEELATIKESLDVMNKAISGKKVCVMKSYAKHYGEKGHRGYRWQKLTDAAKQQGVKVQGSAHRAKSDCLTTLSVMKVVSSGGGSSWLWIIGAIVFALWAIS